MPPKRKPARASSHKSAVVPISAIEKRIHMYREQKVMLDRDLAELYGVPTMALKQQVKRNANRFPPDFTFRLTKQEAESLISQNVILTRRSFSRVLPSAFTEQGVAMLSSVLAGQKDFLKKLDELEKKSQTHDIEIKAIFDALKRLIQVPAPSHRRIGFIAAGPR